MVSSRVSVVMPAYNSAVFIKGAIESVIRQTYENWELLVVDDGSTDDTVHVVQSFRDPRIQLFRAEHAGVSRARNIALEKATGEFIAFLDSDDVWESAKLSIQLKFLQGLDWDMTFCAVQPIQRDGVPCGFSYSFSLGELGERDLLLGRVPLPSATLIRTRCLKQVGNFCEQLKTAEDWELWVRLSRSAIRIAGTGEVLLRHRISDKSLSWTGVSLKDYRLLLRKWNYLPSSVRAAVIARAIHYLTVVERPGEAFLLALEKLPRDPAILLQRKFWYALSVAVFEFLTPRVVHRFFRRQMEFLWSCFGTHSQFVTSSDSISA